jgi:hypothetical protein
MIEIKTSNSTVTSPVYPLFFPKKYRGKLRVVDAKIYEEASARLIVLNVFFVFAVGFLNVVFGDTYYVWVWFVLIYMYYRNRKIPTVQIECSVMKGLRRSGSRILAENTTFALVLLVSGFFLTLNAPSFYGF